MRLRKNFFVCHFGKPLLATMREDSKYKHAKHQREPMNYNPIDFTKEVRAERVASWAQRPPQLFSRASDVVLSHQRGFSLVHLIWRYCINAGRFHNPHIISMQIDAHSLRSNGALNGSIGEAGFLMSVVFTGERLRPLCKSSPTPPNILHNIPHCTSLHNEPWKSTAGKGSMCAYSRSHDSRLQPRIPNLPTSLLDSGYISSQSIYAEVVLYPDRVSILSRIRSSSLPAILSRGGSHLLSASIDVP